MRPLLFANSRISTNQLANRLAEGMPLAAKLWHTVNGMPNRTTRLSPARGLQIEIVDAAANGRRVKIADLGARPLRDQEAQAPRRCLAGG